MSLESTKADDIALVIEEAIVSGELEPGTVLRQEQLSEQFNVSRTPIREALRRLAALGLVSFVPNRGVRVRTISREELHEAFMVRAELESLATEVAATKMTSDDLAELETAQTGSAYKLRRDSDLPFTADNLRFFASAVRHLEGKAAAAYSGSHTSMIRREPIGVVGQVSPWN